MKSDDPFRQLLRESQPDIEVPRDFQAKVWRRISERDEAWGWNTLVGECLSWLAVQIRPVAVAAALVASVAGAGIGAWKSDTDGRTAEARYVASISPFVMAANRTTQ